jgi:putative peptidoglycan lipid II flippase
MPGMVRNIFSVGAWTIVSRLTGFFRDMALAALLGGGALNDAYVAAIKLPNQFRQIFGEGSFNAAYLPTYTGVLETGGKEEAQAFASQVFTLLILSQIALLALVYLDMPLLVALTSPGFVSQPDKFAHAVAMSRIMFPYIAFIAVFALHQGTLNANNAWSAPASAPAAANVCMIAFLGFAAFFPNISPGVAGMASWGFLASGATQLAIAMIDAQRRGLLERLTWPRWTPDVRRFFWMLGPAIGISASYQIGALADQIVGSLLPTGGLSAISYADRLYQLPGGVIIIATGSVLLREMSSLIARGDDRAALNAQNRAASLTIALGAPFVVVFLMIPDLIVSAAFEHGAFKANATRQAAAVLAAYSVGMPALFVDRILAASFFARHDTATPMKVTLAGVALNVALKIALYKPLGAPGLALATAAGLWVKVVGAFILARLRGWTAPDARFFGAAAATVFGCGALALALALADAPLASALAALPRFARETRLLILALVGVVVYFGALGFGLVLTGAAPPGIFELAKRRLKLPRSKRLPIA